MTDEKNNSPEIHLTNKAPETDIPRPKPKHRNYVLSPQARAKLEQARAEKKLERLQKKKQKILLKTKKAKEEVEAPQKFLRAAAGDTKSGHIITDKVLEKVHEDIYGDAEVIFQPNPGPQTDFFSSNEQELLFGGAAGGGKQVLLETIIPTVAGNTTMGEIKVGDQVFSDTGEIRNVIWKSEIDYNPDAYEVEFDTGEVITCDARHLWKTFSYGERLQLHKLSDEYRAKRRSSRPSRAVKHSKKPGVSKNITERNRARQYAHKQPPAGTVRTTKELFDTQLVGSTKRSNHAVLLSAPLSLPVADLPIDPYLLGLWLGDGFSAYGSVGMSVQDMDEVLACLPESECIKSSRVFTKNRKTPFKTVVVDGLTTRLRLLGVKDNKHIPSQYLRASIDQRKELLRGILDTDGYCNKDGYIELGLSNRRLISDCQQLICSLGLKCSLTSKEASIGDKSYGETYRLKFIADFPAFKLERKLKKQASPYRQTTDFRYIVSVRKCNPAPMCCIQVDHPDGMYCVGNTLIPTHNSMALIVDAARDAWCPEHRAIIFRKTLDELRNLISKTKSIYPQLYPKARWLEQKMTWSFPSGAEAWYTYLDRDDDVERYQGQDFNYVGFDEGGNWGTPYCWNYMRSRLRTTTKGLGLYQRITANPGGAGGWWLKKMFIDPAPPNTPFWATDIETGKVLTWPDDERLPDGSPHPRAGLPLFRRKFIPSRLKDNPYLFKDGRYQQNLLALPETQRRRLLDGDWDVVEGAAFPEFYRGVHVVEPFRIPESWIRFRACDYGYARHAAVLWFACDPDGRLYVYRELYIRGATVNKLAELINEIEQKDRVRYGVLDSSMWSSRGDTGPAPAEVMNSYLRPPFRQSDRSPGSRVAGKLELHRRFVVPEPTFIMAADGTKINIPGRPLLQFFSTCTNLIRTIPALQLDKNNPEDVDTDGEDDLYDALRYGIMTRPMKPQFNFMMKPSSRVITTSPVAADRVFGY